jgi:hypothetical protein
MFHPLILRILDPACQAKKNTSATGARVSFVQQRVSSEGLPPLLNQPHRDFLEVDV